MGLCRKNELLRIIKELNRVDDNEMSVIISSIIQRYSKLYPDQEVMFLTLPKNDVEERRRTLDMMCKLLLDQ